MSGKAPELAQKAAQLDTIPNDYADVGVTTTAQTVSLDALPGSKTVMGRMVRLYAVGGDITVRRGEHAGMGADEGLVIASGAAQRFWVDPGGDSQLTVVAGASVTLRVLFDNEIG